MTLNETRQLGIEFERRIQTMIPEKEFDKLDTETIYSFLNQYQDRYIHDIYRNLDNIQSGTKLSSHVESVLQTLLKTSELTASGNSNEVDYPSSIVCELPPDFGMYVRSTSIVSTIYSFKSLNDTDKSDTDKSDDIDEPKRLKIIPNQFVSQNDAQKLFETPNNSLRILRQPVAILSKSIDNKHTLTVIQDRYTNIQKVGLTYYAKPKYFDIMTSTACELPMSVFDDIVSGAVDLYVQYVAGAEANKKRQQEQLRKQQQNEQNKSDEE